MRELNFMPSWYLALHRRRRLIRLQAIFFVAVVIGLMVWHVLGTRSRRLAETRLADLNEQVEISASRVRERQTQQQLREQLQTQERVDASLGLNVESSRLLAMLDAALPANGSLIELQIETLETLPTLGQQAMTKKTMLASRRLRVSLKGVTPSNADIATLLENLSATQFCENVRLIYSRDRVDANHVMSEFNVEFIINLNAEGTAV